MSSPNPREVIIDAFCEVDADLTQVDRKFSICEPRDSFEEYVYGGNVTSGALSLFERAYRVMSAGRIAMSNYPNTNFGRFVADTAMKRPLRLINRENLISLCYCPQAESRLLLSLDHSLGERDYRTQPPTAILLDEAEQPFAVQKNNGERSFYSWRDANVETSRGKLKIPGDYFGQIKYCVSKDPEVYYTETMVPVRVNPDNVFDIKMARPNISLLPKILRQAISEEIGKKNPVLQKYVDDATNFKPTWVQMVVEETLGSRQLATV